MSVDKKSESVQSKGGAVLIQVGAEPGADRGEPDAQAAQKAFVLGQLAMDRGDWSDAEARFAEAAELDWTQAMFVEWRDEARSRITEKEPQVPDEPVDDPGTAPPPTLAMPTTTLTDGTTSLGSSSNPSSLSNREGVQRAVADRAYQLGERARQDGDAVTALVQFEKALGMFPKDPRFIYAVNRTKADLGPEQLAAIERQKQEAAAAEREDAERKGKNAERYFKRGERARRRGVYGEAVQCLEGAVRLQPGNVKYQQALADARAKLRAESTLSKARPVDPGPKITKPPEPQAEAPPAELPLGMTRRQVLLGILAAAAVLLALVSGGSEPIEDEASDHTGPAVFLRLNPISGGASAAIDEPLRGLTGRARAARCAEVVTELDVGSVVLTGSDGGVAVCGAP